RTGRKNVSFRQQQVGLVEELPRLTEKAGWEQIIGIATIIVRQAERNLMNQHFIPRTATELDPIVEVLAQVQSKQVVRRRCSEREGGVIDLGARVDPAKKILR